MAEFQEIMRQWRRLCEPYERCTDCPIRESPIPAHNKGDVDFERLEAIVKDWTKEHPEPTYPSWGEWLSEIGVFQCVDGEWRFAKANEPISADIAEKLELDPLPPLPIAHGDCGSASAEEALKKLGIWSPLPEAPKEV